MSPSRQVDFLRLMKQMDESGMVQVIIATHSPLLMAYPEAQLLRIASTGLAPVHLIDTDHFRLMRDFAADPDGFVEAALSHRPDDE